jgi:predicted patatin/cPLA2 family phospholipase
MPNTALVIEGGGIRGAFTTGVLSELERRGGARFDCAYATSAGAPCAAYSLAGQTDDSVFIWEHFIHGGQLVSMKKWLSGRSLMDIDGLVHLFECILPLRRERLAKDRSLFVPAPNCITGQAELFQVDAQNVLSVLKASMALPVAYGPTVDIAGTPYLDGGLTAAIPIEAALESGAQNILVILTRPRGYRKKIRPQVARAMSYYYRRFPALARAFNERCQGYNDAVARLEELEDAGRVSVIRPLSALPASRMSQERDKIVATLSAGRDAARQWLNRPTNTSAFFQAEVIPTAQRPDLRLVVGG